MQELRQEVRRLTKTVEETNTVVHKLRRSQRWHTLFQIVWWLSVVGITGAAYYYYIQPYVSNVMDAYGNAKDFQVQVQDWFAQFGHKTQ